MKASAKTNKQTISKDRKKEIIRKNPSTDLETIKKKVKY